MADDNLYFSNEQHRRRHPSAFCVLGEMSKSFKAPGTTGIDSACQEPPVLYWTFGRSVREFQQEVEREERRRGQQ